MSSTPPSVRCLDRSKFLSRDTPDDPKDFHGRSQLAGVTEGGGQKEGIYRAHFSAHWGDGECDVTGRRSGSSY
jgi:hypothetical protein